MTYNDKAVLENYHASTVFRILEEENYNILANLKKEDYRFVKKTLVHFCPLLVPEFKKTLCLCVVQISFDLLRKTALYFEMN